jgi:hypothetical protein
VFTGGTHLLVGPLLVLTSVSFPAFAEMQFAHLIGRNARAIVVDDEHFFLDPYRSR